MTLDWPLIGRDEELRAFDDLATTAGSLLFVGPSGVGKSGLLREFEARSRSGGRPTMVVSGSQVAQGVALAPMLAFIPANIGQDSSPTQLFRAMLAEVRRLGQLVVLVDDAHLLDDVSASLVAAIVASTEAAVVLASRSDEVLPEALDALWRQGTTRRFDLPFLDESAVVELLEAVLPGAVDPLVPRDVWKLSKGSPLFVHELVAASLEDGSLSCESECWTLREGLTVSDGLAGLIERRLLNVPAAQTEVLRLLSVHSDVGRRHMERLVGEDAIIDLENRGLIVRSLSGRRSDLRLGHPMYGEVLRQRGPGPTPTSIERLADLIEGSGARRRTDSLAISFARFSIGKSIEPSRLIAAGNQAIALTDYGLAEQLATDPLVRNTKDGLTLRGRALVAQQRFDEADRVFSELLNRCEGDEAADVLVMLANIELEIRADLQRCQEHLNAARHLATEQTSKARVTAGSVTMSFITGWPTIALNDAATIDVSLLHPVERVGLSMVRSTAHLIRAEPAAALETCVNTRSLIELVNAAGWLDEERSNFTEFVSIGLSEPNRAIDLFQTRLVSDAERGEDASILMLVGLVYLANIAGRFDVAQQAATRWTRKSIMAADRMTDGAGWAAVANNATERGDWDLVRRALGERSKLPFELNSAPLPFIASGRLAVNAGEPERGRDLMHRGLDVALSQDLLLFGAEVANQLAVIGDEAGALTALERIISEASPDTAPQWVLADWHAGVAASVARDAGVLERLSDSLSSRGFRADATRNAARAAVHAEHPLEQLRLTLKARALEAESGGGRCLLLAGVPIKLSERELEFTLLAAGENSNRAIAETAVVSQRTVENHLHRAMRKLDATRADLIEILGPGTTLSPAHDTELGAT